MAVLFFGAEAHDMFDAGPVVPAAVEDHDFASGGEMCDVALQIQLAFLSVGRCRQRHHAEHAWADPLGDSFDRTSLAGGVTSFENDNNSQAFVPDPLLKRAELDLQFPQFLLVFVSLHRRAPCRAWWIAAVT